MNLEVKKGEDSVSFHKVPRGINCHDARYEAYRDITKECWRGSGFFTKNYVKLENVIMQSIGYDFVYFSL